MTSAVRGIEKMADLIDRQDAIDTHCAICPDKDKCPDRDFVCPDRELFRMIKPACPEPTKIGKWIYVRKRLARGGTAYVSECSICHKRIMPLLKPNYCPGCGAKMEGTD